MTQRFLISMERCFPWLPLPDLPNGLKLSNTAAKQQTPPSLKGPGTFLYLVLWPWPYGSQVRVMFYGYLCCGQPAVSSLVTTVQSSSQRVAEGNSLLKKLILLLFIINGKWTAF